MKMITMALIKAATVGQRLSEAVSQAVSRRQ